MSRVLDQLSELRGLPETITVDNGPEFSGKCRNESLNENWFSSMEEARDIIETWRQDYNEVRPHSSLGNLTPKEFTEKQSTNTEILTLQPVQLLG